MRERELSSITSIIIHCTDHNVESALVCVLRFGLWYISIIIEAVNHIYSYFTIYSFIL